MPGFFESQIPLNLYLQSLGSWLTPMMKIFTLLGQEDFFIVAIVVVYWIFDRRVGLRVGILLLISNGFNCILKLAFHAPRPFWIDTGVQAMADEPSFGFPSGHTQNATTTWGGFLLPMKRGWAIAVFCVVVILVAISRFYLGMHFLIDAIGGLVFGLLTVALYLKFEHKIEAWVTRRSLKQLLLAALLCSLAFILLFGMVQISLGGWRVPAEWESNALIGWPENPINPLSIRNLIKSAGTILGLLAGAAWIDRKYPAYSVRGSATQKWQRLALGLAGLLVIYAGLGMVISKDSSLLPITLTYVRFALVGLWVTGAAPFLFMKARLVPQADTAVVSA
jgi:membrane-associated phospholipid phosphatase